MKKLFYFWSLAVFLAACISVTSCKKSDDLNNDEIVTVGMKAGGELEGTETPLSVDVRGTPTASRALWGIQVCISPTNPADYWGPLSAQTVAYGVFDDLSQFSINLSKNKKYYFEVTYIPNGKDIIHCFEENRKWSHPFTTSLYETKPTPVNEIIYADDDHLPSLGSGKNALIGSITGNSNIDIPASLYNEVNRYYGYVPAYQPVAGGTITVDMKRTVFGLTFRAKKVAGVNYENLLIRIVPDSPVPKSYTMPISPTNEITEFVIPFICLGNIGVRDSVTLSNYTETIKISIGTVEKPDVIYDGTITVKRNTMHTYNFNMVGEDISSSGMSANFVDGAMSGETTNLN